MANSNSQWSVGEMGPMLLQPLDSSVSERQPERLTLKKLLKGGAIRKLRITDRSSDNSAGQTSRCNF